VTARLVECTFIAIGIVSYLAVVTLHQQSAGGATAYACNERSTARGIRRQPRIRTNAVSPRSRHGYLLLARQKQVWD